MQTMTQAEFARAHGVSRAAVSQWKSAGYLVFHDDAVDVEASNAKLRAARQGMFSWRKARATSEAKLTPHAVNEADAAPLPDVVVEASVSAEMAGVHAAEILLRTMPVEQVQPITDELVARMRRSAVQCLEDEGIEPPPGLATWADHEVFNGEYLVARDWEEMVQEVANAR